MQPVSRLLVVFAAASIAACGPDQGASTKDVAPRLTSGVHLAALDRSVRPQDDFYQFVNGGWLDGTDIPRIYSGYTVYHEVIERVEQQLHEIIERAAGNPGTEGSESQKLGDLYATWMDVETINAAGIEPIRAELEQIAAIDSIDALVRTMASLSRLGIMAPFETYVYPDFQDSSRYTVYLGQSGITMPNRDYYLRIDNENFAKARDALAPYVERLLVRAGVADDEASTAAADIVALETALAEAHWDAVSNRDPKKIYNPFPVDSLDALGQNFDWRAALGIIGISDEKQIIIEQPSFFEALDGLLASVPIETWKHYMTFRLLDGAAGNLDEATAAIRFDYRYRTLYGQEQEKPRWKLGIELIDALLGEAVGKLYVAEHFPPEAKAKMDELVANVIATFDATLDDLAWMSESTRARAREKLSKFTPKIGYPDEWRDYSALRIVPGDHIGNVKRAVEWEHERQIAKLGTPVDKKEWAMTPQTVNAYYSQTKNEIVFPAARLQPPFFQLDADDAINYGAVGGVIGHEISHGFDDKGSQFDGDGNLVDWWTDEDRAAFEARTETLVAQFEKFEPVEGMRINGELTLGENIGDLSGVAMAYRAYVRSLNGKEPPVIDGFSGPQRFFIGYAMSRKGKYRKAAMVSRLASDPHSPLKFRVIGPYRNIDAFHDAFGTEDGDGMWLPPEERVRIW